MEILSPYAPLGSIDRLIGYLKRDEKQGLGDPDLAIRAANKAIGWMENRTNRRLVGRTYRNPVTLTGLTTSANSPSVTGAGFSALYADDDCVGAQLDPGTRILSITNDTNMVLNRPASGSSGAASITFGSAPLQMDGTGRNESVFFVPEYPLNQLISVKYLDVAGNRTALDLTAVRIHRDTGRVVMMNAGLPFGHLNIEIEAHCGYLQPSGTRVGDWQAWSELEGILFRCAQVFFQDQQNSSGRMVQRSIGPMQAHLPSFKMPDDIEYQMANYARL